MSDPVLQITKFDTSVAITLDDLLDDDPLPAADDPVVKQWIASMSAHIDRYGGKRGIYQWARGLNAERFGRHDTINSRRISQG